MYTRPRPLALTLLLLALTFVLLTATLSAGGWVTLTIDELPAAPRAGETIPLRFVVRGHGHAPIFWDGFAIAARNPESGETLYAESRRAKPEGHYLAEITFPSAGTWEWRFVNGGQTQTWVNLAPLEVLPPLAAASTGAAFVQTNTLAWLAALAATLSFGILVAAYRRNGLKKLAPVAGAAAALILAVGLLLWPSLSPSAAQPDVSAPASDPDPAYGRALFLAKGCATCHVHAEARAPISVGIGPVLNDYQASPAFLRLWLANPAEIKPGTTMPDLDLSAAEIEALIAFLGK